MNLIDPQSLPRNPGNPSYFSGDVTLRPMPTPGIEPVTLTRVEFSPEARTNWHTHGGVQILFIVTGRCRFQRVNGPVEEAGAGETIFIPAGEKHWHGANPNGPMIHVAMNFAPENVWLEPVTAEQYGG